MEDKAWHRVSGCYTLGSQKVSRVVGCFKSKTTKTDWKSSVFCFCNSPSLIHNTHSAPQNILLPQALSTYISAWTTLPSISTQLFPSLPSGPMLLLWLSYVEQLILSFFIVHRIHQHSTQFIICLQPLESKLCENRDILLLVYMVSSVPNTVLGKFYKYLLEEWINCPFKKLLV